MTKGLATTLPAPNFMGIREYARHRAAHNASGKSHTAVQKAIESGRLAASVVREPNGRVRIDQEKADLEWALTADPAQQRAPDELRKATPPAAETPKLQQHLLTEDGATEPVEPGQEKKSDAAQLADRVRLGFSAQRARRETADAALTELKLAEKRGELVSAVAVTDETFRLARKLSEAILAVPRTVAARIGAKNAKIVERELQRALLEMKKRADE